MKKNDTPVLIVGTTDACPDIRYLTGFTAPDAVVLLASGRRCTLVVSALEYGRASATTKKNVVVVTPDDIAPRKSHRNSLSGWALAVLRAEGIRKVAVPPFFPVVIADYLRKNRITVRVSKDILFPRRQVKSVDELDLLAESQSAACAAMSRAMSVIKKAKVNRREQLVYERRILTSERLRSIIETTLMDHGCMAPEGTVASCGASAADPHAQGNGPLLAGQTIVLDIFPRHKDHGYWGDLTRTVIKGCPSAAQKKMYLAVQAAQKAALAAIRPGVSGASIHRIAAETLKKRGFATKRVDNRFVGFIHGTGHGVGLEIHEQPSLGLSKARLKSGNVVTVEPGLYYPELGGVRIEDTIIVTPKGPKYLARCPKQFEL